VICATHDPAVIKEADDVVELGYASRGVVAAAGH
jgi:hypothetical protein